MYVTNRSAARAAVHAGRCGGSSRRPEAAGSARGPPTRDRPGSAEIRKRRGEIPRPGGPCRSAPGLGLSCAPRPREPSPASLSARVSNGIHAQSKPAQQDAMPDSAPGSGHRLPADRPRYTPSTTFQTFPFPAGLTPDVPAASYAAEPRAVAVAEAARRLVELRDRWLNPPEWVEWVDEPAPGYPRRPVPRGEAAAKAIRKRTLTNLADGHRLSSRDRNPSAFRFSAIAASSRVPSACCACSSVTSRRIFASNGSPSSGCGSAPT